MTSRWVYMISRAIGASANCGGDRAPFPGRSPAGPSQLLHLPDCAEPVPGQEVQVYVEEGLRREFLVPGPKFGTVDVQDLGTGLPLRSGLSGPQRLTARARSKHGLPPAFFPRLLGSWPRLSGILFPCAVPCTARACAQLLPDSQGD